MNFNVIHIAGRLTRDPELTTIPSGTSLCKFGIASNHRYGDTDEVCFVDCTAWDKSAEFVNRFFTKGKSIMVTGRLQLDKWVDNEGNNKSKHVIRVDRATFTDEPKQDGQAPAPRAPAAPPVPEPAPSFDDNPF